MVKMNCGIISSQEDFRRVAEKSQKVSRVFKSISEGFKNKKSVDLEGILVGFVGVSEAFITVLGVSRRIVNYVSWSFSKV